MRYLLVAPILVLFLLHAPALADMPDHSIETSDLKPRAGKRVQVNVSEPVSKAQCIELIKLHRSKGEPDGQISVHAPSLKLGGHVTPHCVENYNGEGIQIHEYLY